MTPLQVRDRCRASLFATAWYLCGYRKLSRVLHLAMTLWLQKRWSEGAQRALVLVTRDYFKTSCLGIAGVVWHLIRDPESTHLYCMHNVQTARTKMDEVRGIFESEAMRKYFPELHVGDLWKKTEKWTATEFTIPRDNTKGTPSITCMGITGGSTGHHFTHIWWDDVVKGDDQEAAGQIDSAIAQSKKVTFLWEDRRSSLWTVLGTLHEGGFYERLMKHPKFAILTLGAEVDDRFEDLIQDTGVEIPALDDPYIQSHVLPENRGPVVGPDGEYVADAPWSFGTPIFPEQETCASIAEAVLDSEEHAMPQLFNLPSGSEARKFKAEWFPSYTVQRDEQGRFQAAVVDGVAAPLSFMQRYLAIDPTGGLSSSCDHYGIVVMGWVPTMGRGFILDFKHGKGDALVQIDHALTMADTWGVDAIIPESVAFQVVFRTFLEQEMTERVRKGRLKKFYSIEPYTRGHKSKHLWIFDSLVPFCQRKQICVQLPEHQEIVDQAVNFRVRETANGRGKILGPSPALLDCLSMMRERWQRITAKLIDDGIRTEDTVPGYATAAGSDVVRYGLACSRWTGGSL